jgi:hypothetical protein
MGMCCYDINNIQTMYGHLRGFSAYCLPSARSTNESTSILAGASAQDPTPPASPGSWCLHVQTVHRFEYFSSENPAHPNHAAPEFMVAIGFGSHVRPLAHLQLTRRTESSAMVTTGESSCVETLSPVCRSFLSSPRLHSIRSGYFGEPC